MRTDHKSLKWLLTWKTPSTPQYFSWIYKLQQYDFEIVYRERQIHGNTDALSRMESCHQCNQVLVNSLAKTKPVVSC